MSAYTEALTEEINDLIDRVAKLRHKGDLDLAKILEDQIKDVRARLAEANAALAGKQLLKG